MCGMSSRSYSAKKWVFAPCNWMGQIGQLLWRALLLWEGFKRLVIVTSFRVRRFCRFGKFQQLWKQCWSSATTTHYNGWRSYPATAFEQRSSLGQQRLQLAAGNWNEICISVFSHKFKEFSGDSLMLTAGIDYGMRSDVLHEGFTIAGNYLD